MGTQVPIYVHEIELKHAFYSVATGYDHGVYLDHYLKFVGSFLTPLPSKTHNTQELNWQPFHGEFYELAQGLQIRHAPGHTPGLCILQVNLAKNGTFIFTSDMYHVKEVCIFTIIMKAT